MHCAAGQAGAAPQPPCLGISSSHSCNSLEDAGLGLFVPSGAERAYFRLCTMHFRLGCAESSAQVVGTAAATKTTVVEVVPVILVRYLTWVFFTRVKFIV